MIEDWTVNYKPDLLTFIPYEWSFNIVLRDFEMVWLGNQHNWIECTSNRQDNGMWSRRTSNRKVVGSTPVGRTRDFFFPSMPVSLLNNTSFS